jgi:hypothetical protein
MGAIALGTVSLVVALARIDRTAPDPASDDPVPETLAGGIEVGDVPAAVTGAVSLPVVGARRLDVLPGGLSPDCGGMLGFVAEEPGLGAAPERGIEQNTQFVSATATPEGVDVALRVDAIEGVAPEFSGGDTITCQARFDGGDWIFEGSTTTFGGGGQGMSTSCCDSRGLSTARSGVTVPQSATWLLADRGSYYLAIPVSEGETATVSWSFRDGRFNGGAPTPMRVLFLDEDGEVVEETTVGGGF